jgi:hypothetical protein
VRSEPTGLFQSWRGVTSLPSGDDVVDGALRVVAHLAQGTVAGADGVSVSLRCHGRLATVATSSRQPRCPSNPWPDRHEAQQR